MLDQNKQKKWLIKDDDHITGPFTENEIQERLESGRISPAAMACLPDQSCWIFIINYSEFISWAEKINVIDTNLTKTLSTFGTSGTITFDTTTSTFAFSAQTILGGKAAAPSSSHPSTSSAESSSTVSSSHKEIELPYQVIEDKSTSSISATTKPATYKNTILKWSLFIMLLTGGSIYIWFLQNQKSIPINETKNETNFAEIGQMYFASGYYLRAIKHWQTTQQKGQLKKEDNILLKIAQLQFQNKVDKGQQLLQLSSNPEIKTIIQALIYLKNQDEDSAIKYFTQLANHAQSKEILNAAKMNWILLDAKKGHCAQIKNKKLYHAMDNALADLVFALCTLSTNPTMSANENHIRQIKETLQTMIQSPQAYYQEALLALTYISVLEKLPNKTLSFIRKLLDANPYLTEDYYYDFFINTGIYTWPEWINLCKKVYQSNKNHQFYIAFYSYCLSRAGQHQLAKQHIKNAHTMDPEDPLIKSIYAYTIQADSNHKNFNNKKRQFIFTLSDAVDSNEDYNYFLPYILQARFCERNQDLKCAIRYWQLVLQNDPVSAYAGIANVHWNRKMYKEARQYMTYGLEYNFSTRYKPLLLLDQQLKKNNF